MFINFLLNNKSDSNKYRIPIIYKEVVIKSIYNK